MTKYTWKLQRTRDSRVARESSGVLAESRVCACMASWRLLSMCRLHFSLWLQTEFVFRGPEFNLLLRDGGLSHLFISFI